MCEYRDELKWIVSGEHLHAPPVENQSNGHIPQTMFLPSISLYLLARPALNKQTNKQTNKYILMDHGMRLLISWWRHQMENFSALLVPGEFPAQKPVTQSFDVFFDLRQNKRLSKQSWGWWSETPSSSLWRHRNDIIWRRYAKFLHQYDTAVWWVLAELSLEICLSLLVCVWLGNIIKGPCYLCSVQGRVLK